MKSIRTSSRQQQREQRGLPPRPGSFILLDEARAALDREVQLRGVTDGKVWKWDSGDYYDGEWAVAAWGAQQPVQHGRGVMYNAVPSHMAGLVYEGDWVNGMCVVFVVILCDMPLPSLSSSSTSSLWLPVPSYSSGA